jgi:hypothetical protein
MKIFPSRKYKNSLIAHRRLSKDHPLPPFRVVKRGETFEESPETITDPIQQQRQEEKRKLKSMQKPCVISSEDAQLVLQRMRQQRKASDSAKEEPKASTKVLLKLGSLLHLPANTSKVPVPDDTLLGKEDMADSHDSSETEDTASTVSSNLGLSPYDEEKDCFLMTADDFVQLAAPFHDILEDMLQTERLMGANGRKNKKKKNLVGRGEKKFHRKMPTIYTSSKKKIKNKNEERSPSSQSSIDTVPRSKESNLKKALASFKSLFCFEGEAGSHGFAATPIERTPTTCNTITTESIENVDECYTRSYLDSMESMATYCPDESTLSLCTKSLSLSGVVMDPPAKTLFIDEDMVDDVKSQLPPGQNRFVEVDMAPFLSVTAAAAAAAAKEEGSLRSSSSIPSVDVEVPCVDANKVSSAAICFVPAEIIQTDGLVVAYGGTQDGGDGNNHADTIEIVLLLDEISYTKVVVVDDHERDPTSTANNKDNCPEIHIGYRQDSFSTITSAHSVCSQESNLDFQLKMLEDELDVFQGQYEEIIDSSLQVGSKLNDLVRPEQKDGTMSI